MGKMSAQVLKKTLKEKAPTTMKERKDLPKVDYSNIPMVKEIPFLIGIQLDSFNWFLEEGLRDLFERIFLRQPGTRVR
jgi:DNA-directed RNA polymerase beta subunit